MNDKFLNDNWLREQLQDEEVVDEVFTASTLLQIKEIQTVANKQQRLFLEKKNTNRNFVWSLLLSIFVAAFGIGVGLLHYYPFIIEFTSTPTLFDSSKLSAVNPIFLGAVGFVFMLIWLTEDSEIL
jgi:hypothetical protein